MVKQAAGKGDAAAAMSEQFADLTAGLLEVESGLFRGPAAFVTETAQKIFERSGRGGEANAVEE